MLRPTLKSKNGIDVVSGGACHRIFKNPTPLLSVGLIEAKLIWDGRIGTSGK